MNNKTNEFVDLIETEVLPAYRTLGDPSAVWLQGSVVMGYTDASDLDVMMLWPGDAVPAERGQVVKVLDSVRRDPWVVDYRDIHIERFVIHDREVNVGHRCVSDFERDLERVHSGDLERGDAILDPLIAVAGFAYGSPIIDLSTARDRLAPFPDLLRAAAFSALQSGTDLAHLHRFEAQGDALQFDKAFVDCVERTARAAFSSRDLYFPGVRWLRRSMDRFEIPSEMVAAYDEAMCSECSRSQRLQGLKELIAVVARQMASDGAG